jgi:TolA-binding protein
LPAAPPSFHRNKLGNWGQTPISEFTGSGRQGKLESDPDFPTPRLTMKLRLLGPAALLIATSACFATRNDVRILQEDILAFRTMQARTDSARAKQLTDISTGLTVNLASINVVRDSVRELGMRLVSFQGATRQELYSLGQSLVQLGSLMGASADAMRAFRADLEERNRQTLEAQMRAAGQPTTPGDTTKPVAPVVNLTEGPNVLYQIGRDQLTANAWSAARDAFTELLTKHQTSDLVPDAMLGIADAFDAEGNRVQGDSVYRALFTKYPSDELAPRAMYKLGLSLTRQKKVPDARKAMQDVVKLYPRSDEATLATDWLARNPG